MATQLTHLALIAISLVLAACGGGGGGGGGGETRSIVGAWSFQYPDSQCEEFYFFNDDETFEINSAEEIVSGVYQFQETASNRHKLTLTFTAENLRPDCSGVANPSVGDRGEAFIDFVSDTETAWYDSKKDGNLIVTMREYVGSPNSIRSSVNAGPDAAAFERSNITLAGSSDLSAIRRVQWSQLSGPPVTFIANQGFQLVATLPSVAEDTVVTLNMAIELDSGEYISDTVAVSVVDYTDIADAVLDDDVLSECVDGAATAQSATEVSELDSIDCDGVNSLAGLDQFVFLSNIRLTGTTLSSLAVLENLEFLNDVEITGNQHLTCASLEQFAAILPGGARFVTDENCIDSRPIEIGALGFDMATDDLRQQIYVSVPSKSEIVVISTVSLRVVDRIALPGSPYGIDLSIDEERIFVALRDPASVAVIDLDDRNMEIISLAGKTGHPDTFDVVEGAPGRLFVSASPVIDGFSYIAQIDLNEFNLATRVAGERIIRAGPRFARSPDFESVYLSEGFSPNSLYKLSLLDDEADVILEDDHGSVNATYIMSVNQSGSRIAIGSGQVLRTGSFVEEGRVSHGISAASTQSNTLFVADTDSTIQLFDFDSLEQVGAVTTTCEYGESSRIAPVDGDSKFALLQEDVLCLHGRLPRFTPVDPLTALRFDDRGLEQCVIDAVSANSGIAVADIEVLDCSASSINILNLAPVERLPGLRQLNLSGHNVLSYLPLQQLDNLTTLVIMHSGDADLSPLQFVTSLTDIDVRGNERASCAQLDDLAEEGISVLASECTDYLRIALGGIGHDMVYDAASNSVYVSVPSQESVSEIDIETAEVTQNYSFAGQPRGLDLSTDGLTLYVALRSVGDIAYLDIESGDVETIDLSAELGDDRTWDVAEVSPNRIVVSSNPGSNNFAYIVEVRRDLLNRALRVADEEIIRGAPVFAVSDDNQSVYVGEGFNPNSLFKLDAADDALALVQQDEHGSIAGAGHLTLNTSGTRIYLESGQVVSTNTFLTVAEFPAGRSWLSADGVTLYIAEGEADRVGVYDTSSAAKLGSRSIGCELTEISSLAESDSGEVLAMGDDAVCLERVRDF